MSSFNAYNSKDLGVLLELKRQESQAILDIVRCTQPNMPTLNLILIVVNTIRAQLGVKKLTLLLYDETTDKIKIEKNFGFKWDNDYNFDFLKDISEITNVQAIENHPLASQKVEYIIPINRNSVSCAWFFVADFADSEEEKQNDLIFIETVGTILVIAIDNAKLFENQMKQQKINQELELAEKIQSHLLPRNLSVHHQLEIATFIKAHYKVGGDFFDIIKINEDEIFFCIADVSGKGISSALLVSSLQAHIHAHVARSTTKPSIKSIVGHLNKSLFDLTNGEKFVTLFLGIINFKKRMISYVNAGHNPPIFLLKRKIVHLENGCIPLGIMPITKIEVGSLPFFEGDILFCYTDGFVEQENHNGDFLGSQSIVEYLKNTKIYSAQQVVDDAVSIYNQFRKGFEPADDTTLLVLKFL